MSSPIRPEDPPGGAAESGHARAEAGPGHARAEADAGKNEAVACHDVSVRYGPVEAVCGASLSVPQGEVHVLLGASGSGKTTLLRAIAGLERVHTGRIDLAGRAVDDAGRPGATIPPEDRGLGFVFQDYALFPHLDVEKNVAFGRGADPERARIALARVGLAELSSRLPAELSGGQQQRVALARALAIGPSVLLLDEPFSGIDERLRRTLRASTLDVIRSAGVTAIFVTHSMDEAFAIGDRMSVMADGRILQTGRPETLYRTPVDATVALAVGDASLVPATLSDGRNSAVGPLGELSVRACEAGPPGGTEGQLVVRPEDVRIHPSKDVGAGLSGRIVRRTFLGARTELDLCLTTPDGEVALRARLDGIPDGALDGTPEGAEETVRVSLAGPVAWVPAT